MGVKSGERMALIHDLDMQHQKNIHKTELIHRDEEARLLQLRVLSVRDENALLKDKLTQQDMRISLLARQGDKVRIELDDNKAQAGSKDAQLKKQAIELANLKAEVDSLNASMQASGKTLQEKFALTRELERLRPEMEHLQSQLANHQAIVAEKRGLQRQLDSLEVELENEKRAKQRSPNKETDGVIRELRSRLAIAEKKLATDQKERDKMRMEHERELAEAHGHSERLEERISTLKMKLKGVQSELRETQAELETCRTNLQEAQAGSRCTKDRTKGQMAIKSKPNGKRRAPELVMDDPVVLTPGHDDTGNTRPARKRAVDHALFGEKSTFSVTPFLNRTKTLADDSVEELSYLASAAENHEALSVEPDGPSPVQTGDEPPSPEPAPKSDEIATAPKLQRPRGRPRTKPLSETSASEKNRAVPHAKRSAGRKQTTLDKVEEEPLPKEQEKKNTSLATKEMKKNSVLEVEGMKKKRKLLGGINRTFEDEDGGETPTQRPAKLQLGARQRLKAPLGGAVGAFAAGSTFSPLKRDRRGVNASFLS